MFSVRTCLLAIAIWHGYVDSHALRPRAGSPQNPDLPIVDLGQSLYQAAAVNDSRSYYTFSNIRYAAAPIGELRFTAPVEPIFQDRGRVSNGSTGNICPQALPNWWIAAFQNLGEDAAVIPQGTSQFPQSEDCLFLDVVVPKKVFHRRNANSTAPVLVWLHGGGFFFGDKASIYNPAGLLAQSKDEIIYVALNYRLGAFGFLSGTDETGNQTTRNAGLLDQRFAFKWIQKNIHLFGGNASDVTIFGESAGGGSVIHHTQAYGGSRNDENKLFNRALAQSPAVLTVPKPLQRLVLDGFLDAANVSSVNEAKQLPSTALQEANAAVLASSPYGSLTLGPVVDGDLIPDLPSKLYLDGRFNRDLTIAAGYNKNEGRLFTPPNTDFETYVSTSFPLARPEDLTYLRDTLYPAVYDGSQPYTTPLERLTLAIAEGGINCNAYALARAYRFQTNNYLFSIPPAVHAQDLAYTFFNAATSPPGVNASIANILQGYIAQFALSGNPNREGLPDFPKYGEGARVVNLTETGAGVVADPSSNPRCLWWQQGLIYGGQY
ncbi:MAG: hypothetical protein M1817_002262 [Caeruleum heppii]|nr:MAG: hypothetical protein M1817_002262 [Caeruleum heppii]